MNPRPLTILSVAYPFAPVGPDAVGGAEAILSTLDRALVAAGHRSVVVASEGSRTAGELVAVPAVTTAGRTTIAEADHHVAHAAHREAVAWVLRRYAVDLVHLHGVDFHAYLPPPGPPALATLHLPPAWYPPQALRPTRPRTFLHCVSASQHRACPPGAGPLLADVPNGVEVDRRPPRLTKRRFALALGRICPEKGLHLALDAAARAGVPLLLAGRLFRHASHVEYFEHTLKPRLADPRAARLLGTLAGGRKRRLLVAARCLLVPSLCEETSSLVAMEALAAGTPVVAFRRGALPDIVEHGRTGFLVDDVAGMTDAVRQADRIDPAACRAAARARFSAETMVARYLDLYRRLAAN